MMHEPTTVMEALRAHRKANSKLVKAIVRARRELAENVDYAIIHKRLGKVLEHYDKG